MSGIAFDFKDGKIEFGVMRLPNRRNACLYKMRGANVDVLAYFRSDGCAEDFECLLDKLIDRAKQGGRIVGEWK